MKKSNAIFFVLIALIAVGSVVVYFMWTKPKRSVDAEPAISITAAQLVANYQAGEPAANQKYLDKALAVTGKVSAVSVNQDGKSTITLASDDAFTGVFCTMRTNETAVAQGEIATIKGICSGMLSDVRLREAVIVK